MESLATATLVVLVIRTRRVPFFTSKPATGLAASLIGINLLAFILTLMPFAKDLGFVPLPLKFYFALAIIVVVYLGLVELAKQRIFSPLDM